MNDLALVLSWVDFPVYLKLAYITLRLFYRGLYFRIIDFFFNPFSLDGCLWSC